MTNQVSLLIEKRNKLIADTRAILDKAEAARGKDCSLTTEERAQYDPMWVDQGKLKDEIDAIGGDNKRRAELEAEERELQTTNRSERPETIRPATDRPDPATTRTREEQEDGSARHRRNLWRSRPCEALQVRKHFPERATPEYNRAYRSHIAGMLGERQTREERALSSGLFTEGGATYMSEQFLNELIKFVDDQTFVRRLSRTIQVRGADSAFAPSLDADPGDSDWTSELATGNEDSTMAFGGRKLTPHPIAKRIKISKTLIQRSAMDIVGFAQQRLAYKMGITLEKALLTGTGAQQPLGIFTASALGISTSRDVSTDNTTTAMTADGLKNAFYSLKEPHRASPACAWVVHRDGLLMVSKFKDGEGRYLWQQAITDGDPDRLMGKPVFSSEYAPNTFTTGLYVGIVGNFDWCWIVESMNYEVQQLSELYAETNQVGLITRAEIDAAPVLEEAFARIKLA
jgi:HK97 family phage major capsid protein